MKPNQHEHLDLKSHPAGRVLGECVYVQREDNLRMRATTMFDFITTNVRDAGPPLTREFLDRSMRLQAYTL